MQVYLHEFNILMAGKVYLPNASGMLRAYAETFPEVRDAYEFKPFIFVRQKPEKIAEMWDSPSVLAFSSSMWNHELNLALAKIARERFPNALIVFGGPHVPTKPETLLKRYPFVDIAVKSEGEATFAELLQVHANGRDFSKVKGIAYRDIRSGECLYTLDRELLDINLIPSPYLAGYYDTILVNVNGIEYQIIIETNRGCPFHCAFCAWGNSIVKVRTFDMERLKREIEWVGKMRIPYVFGADANFGMIPRDREIAELFAKTKKESNGYPKSFRVCYGKNAVDRVFETAKVLETNNLTTGVTVSFQSTDAETLNNIGRSNIKLEVYRDLLKRYRSEKIRVYTELILGLPGETYESFSRGIEEVFEAGLYDQAGIFMCQVLPNTGMDDPAYAAKHGLVLKRIELAEFHAQKRAPGEVTEYEDIVVATNSMPHEDWKRANRLAWMAQTIHGLKLGFFVALYLHKEFGVKYTELFEYLMEKGNDASRFPVIAGELRFHADYLQGLLRGEPQCLFMDEFGKISWQIEEATFLRLAESHPHFYEEFLILVCELLTDRGINFDGDVLSEVFTYQFARTARPYVERRAYMFGHTIPGYFDELLHDRPASIHLNHQTLIVDTHDYEGDKENFARQVIWFGRRDCRTLESVTWS